MNDERIAASDPPIVIKVGGSLYDVPEFKDRFTRFLQSLDSSSLVIVPGGGVTADVVRKWDRLHNLGEEAAHWLALRALTFNAHWLQSLIPQTRIVGDVSGTGWRILDAFTFAQEDDTNQGALPHVWTATSDALAARVAVVTRAQRLVLLKSVDIPDGIDWRVAADRGWVDSVLPIILQQCRWQMTIQAVNLRKM